MVTRTATVSHNYSYGEVLANSKKVAWTEDQVLNGRSFDLTKRFLPNSLSGVDGISCLDDDEKRQLNQIMGNAYCHLFAFVRSSSSPPCAKSRYAAPTVTRCASGLSCASRRRN